MNDRYATEDNNSVTDISASGQTYGNMSVASESGFNSSSDGYDNRKKADSSIQEQDVAKQEQQAVNRSKLVVALFLLLAACASAAGTYLFVEQQERKDFEDQFHSYAMEFVAVTRQKTDQLFNALNSFSVSVSSEAKATNQSWPFVTISDYSTKARLLGELIDVPGAGISFCPIVNGANHVQWATHTMEDAPGYFQNSVNSDGFDMTADELMALTTPLVHYYDEENGYAFTLAQDTALPLWQYYPFGIEPLTQRTYTNLDLMASRQSSELFNLASATLNPVIGLFESLEEENGEAVPLVLSQIMQPIFKNVETREEDKEMVGVFWMTMEWTRYFENFFTVETDAITLLVRSSCPRYSLFDQQSVSEEEVNVISYEINGPEATVLGEYDAHDPKYESLEVASILVDLNVDSSKIPKGECIPKLSLHLYPTEKFEEAFYTSKRFLYAGVVIAIFAFTSLVFLLYDFFVGRRQRKVMDRIKMQDLIVSNVFPTAIRDRLYDGMGKSSERVDPLDIDGENDRSSRAAPMADLFPDVTIIFADIVGFTAWSSAREPPQVFDLLETIYAAFDRVAYRHNVFKVETVGDCYVAAAGLPEPMKDHAVAACKFARDCLKKMKEITLKLDVTLGPDTSGLRLRVGIHSGQVTAGVLRGERSRFQLFGDSMNTAARMESTGRASCIQISQTTADLLKEGGFDNMTIPRRQKTLVKGKGEMQTYWLRSTYSKRFQRKNSNQLMESTISEEETVEDSFSSSEDVGDKDSDLFDMSGVEGMSKTERLVEWNVEVLSPLLQQIVATRGGSRKSIKPLQVVECNIRSGQTILEEFVPIIHLKRPDSDLNDRRQRYSSTDVGDDVKSELRRFLSNIAELYTDSNPFHNFEHASHVTASVKKLLKRIVNVDSGNGLTQQNGNSGVNMVDLAGHSYGITSDPLTQFAVVFSAIVHDLDHPGVPNAQLVKEGAPNAELYKNKSVAEQNSVDIAWTILMKDEYQSLRSCIYQTEEELRRFRQLVVNTVMATDIVDKELQALRKQRWETAFSDKVQEPAASSSEESESEESQDRKATIVIEHLIQASDVAHTMQHWYIYKSWNEKFFCECYKAYKSGRADVDPSINWYKGEIGFFDFYVIPLAKKLDNCGVFGVSSHEYLNYAMANRAEWVREGGELVKQFMENYNKSEGKH